jgi:hypothetical protein
MPDEAESSNTQCDNDAIPAALRHFDELPDSSFIGKQVLGALTNWSLSTINRRCRDGTLKPFKLGPRNVGFRVGDVRVLLDSARPA